MTSESTAETEALPRDWFARSPVEVAPELLGTILVVGDRSARVVEVEAYEGESDPASHAWRGPTPRTLTMFGLAGHLYVYRSYGIHWCANVVCDIDGVAGAVLLRGVAPLTGTDAMRRARGVADRELTNGPGKLCQALGIDGTFDGADLTGEDPRLRLVRGDTPPPADPVVTTRIGISRAIDRPWRWHVPGDPNVSRSSGRGGTIVS
jgi:DNA-3-methyladenine glycosylase